MKLTKDLRAEILVQALPYIQKYHNKTVVIKYGGNSMLNEELKSCVMEDMVLLQLVGIKVVLIHGGGPEITDTLNALGKKTEFIDGLRVTDKETVDIVQMVLSGKVNKSLVNHLNTQGGKAVGLSGVDGSLIEAKPLKKELGYVGEITKINIKPITDLLEKNYIPVISTIALDKKGNTYNINADTAASKIAEALNAECLITMTDIAGIMKDKNDESSLIPLVDLSDLKTLFTDNVIQGGMIPKVQSCVEAVNSGVKKVFILDGRVAHAIIVEMLTDEGVGTMVVKDKGKL